MIRGVTTGSVPGRRLGLGGLTPSGRAVVPAGWSLYDFANTIFSYAVVSYAMGLWLVEDTQFGKANGAVRVQCRDCRQRRDQRHRLADPRRAERPRRRSAPPVPALLHGALHRPDGDHRPEPGVRRPRPVHDRELRLPVGPDLLRRDAEDRQLPGDARQAVGDRRGGRVLRDDRDRRPDLRARPADRERVLRRGGAVRAVRDPAVPRRPRGAAARWNARTGHPRGHRGAGPAADDDPRRPDRARPEPLPDRPLLLFRRGQHDHRRDGDRRDRGDGPDEHRREPDPARAGDRRGRWRASAGAGQSTGSGRSGR